MRWRTPFENEVAAAMEKRALVSLVEIYAEVSWDGVE